MYEGIEELGWGRWVGESADLSTPNSDEAMAAALVQ